MFSLPLWKDIMKDWTPPTYQVVHCAFFTQGFLMFISTEPVPQAHDIFKRFAKLFEQTYTRFLDLQKAEALAREAKIEAALERVRSKTMAMHNSKEVGETVVTLFDQLVNLGLNESDRCGIGIMHDDYIMEAWTALKTNEAGAELVIGHISMKQHALLQGAYEGWKKKQESFQYILEGDDKVNYFNIVNSQPDYRAKRDIGTLPPKVVLTAFYFREGALYAFSGKELSSETSKILARFAGVFGQTYRRYLDLQKAEAQAREAQIQLALERVRARTMAMQRSDELTNTAALLFQQIKELGIHQWGNAFQLWDDDMKAVTSWTGNQGGNVSLFKLPTTEDPIMINIVNAAQRKEALYVEAMGGEALVSHYKYTTSLPGLKEVFEKLAEEGFTRPKFQVFHAAYFTYGYILFITHEQVPAEHDIFKRFAKVFEQTYTRFLDLQKAETQAREARIENALEKVRSRSLAMHKSDELKDIATVVFEKLRELNIVVDGGITISIYPDGSRDQVQWVAAPDLISSARFRLPYTDDTVSYTHLKAKESGLDFFAKTYSFEEKNNMLNYLFEHTDFKNLPEDVKSA